MLILNIDSIVDSFYGFQDRASVNCDHINTDVSGYRMHPYQR